MVVGLAVVQVAEGKPGPANEGELGVQLRNGLCGEVPELALDEHRVVVLIELRMGRINRALCRGVRVIPPGGIFGRPIIRGRGQPFAHQ